MDFECTVDDTVDAANKATGEWTFPEPARIGMPNRLQTLLDHLAEVAVQGTTSTSVTG